MKNIVTLSFLIALALAPRALYAQNTDTTAEKIFTWAPELPVFKAENGDFKRFTVLNIQYPAKAMKKKIQGTIFVSFVIEKDGTISQVAATKGPEELQAEALRLINLTNGLWAPAADNGVPVRYKKIQPITFKLN
ncbi:MAG TPA: energy transducer TonB [Cytophagaceae bacterium]|jgi:protein TonB